MTETRSRWREGGGRSWFTRCTSSPYRTLAGRELPMFRKAGACVVTTWTAAFESCWEWRGRCTRSMAGLVVAGPGRPASGRRDGDRGERDQPVGGAEAAHLPGQGGVRQGRHLRSGRPALRGRRPRWQVRARWFPGRVLFGWERRRSMAPLGRRRFCAESSLGSRRSPDRKNASLFCEGVQSPSERRRASRRGFLSSERAWARVTAWRRREGEDLSYARRPCLACVASPASLGSGTSVPSEMDHRTADELACVLGEKPELWVGKVPPSP